MSYILPGPSIRPCLGSLTTAAGLVSTCISSPPSSGWLNSQSVALSISLLYRASIRNKHEMKRNKATVSRRAFLECPRENPISMSNATFSGEGSGFEDGAGCCGAGSTSMSGSSMCSIIQLVAWSAFCVANTAFTQRTRGKPISISIATMPSSTLGFSGACYFYC